MVERKWYYKFYWFFATGSRGLFENPDHKVTTWEYIKYFIATRLPLPYYNIAKIKEEEEK